LTFRAGALERERMQAFVVGGDLGAAHLGRHLLEARLAQGDDY
jgi:hypothetical protein